MLWDDGLGPRSWDLGFGPGLGCRASGLELLGLRDSGFIRLRAGLGVPGAALAWEVELCSFGVADFLNV